MYTNEAEANARADHLNTQSDRAAKTVGSMLELIGQDRPERCECMWDTTPLADGTWDVQYMLCEDHA